MKKLEFNRGNTASIVIGAVAIIIIAIILVNGARDEEKPIVGETNGDDVREWQTFESEEYGFSIEYPQDWEVATSSDEMITPRFVFYEPPKAVDATLPYDHFVNDTFVGIYPEGIPTEALQGTRGLITEDAPTLSITQDSLEYETEDGTPFVWWLVFSNTPESWGSSGYAWGRAEVANYDTVCIQNGEEVGTNACDFPQQEGAGIVHRGDVNSEDWQMVKDVLKSITFN